MMRIKKAISRIFAAAASSALLTAAVGVPLFASGMSAAEDQLTDGSFYYELKDDNTYVITQCVASVVSAVPEMTNGIAVSEIAEGAFINCTGITELTIPDTVKKIGKNAFYGCSGLGDVRLPSKLTEISDGTFFGCSSLTTVEIPDTVTAIGSDAFRRCDHLTDIALPDGVTSVGKYAFYQCTSLRNITLSDSLTDIGGMAFGELLSLESFDVNGCSAFTFENNMLMDSNKTTVYGSTSTLAGDLIIPEGVRTLEMGAFSSSPNVEYVHIPSTVTTIGTGAFCNTLINSMGSLTKLKNVDFSEGLTTISEGAFRGTAVEQLSLPTTLKSIGIGAFENCLNLNRVIISEGVESIGKDAFLNCLSLKNLTVPKSVKTIGDHAFGYSLNGSDEYSLVDGFKMSVFSGSEGAKYARSSDIEYEHTDNVIKRVAFIVVAVGLVLAAIVFAVVLMHRSRKSPKLSEKRALKKAKEQEEEANYKNII